MSKLSASDKKLIFELSLMLAAKLILLFIIWHLFFSNTVEISSSETMAEAILSENKQGEQP